MRLVQGPGGSTGGSSSGFGDVSIAGGEIALQAGMPIVPFDLVTLDEDGLAYAVTDAACVVNPNRDQQLIAATTPVASASMGSGINQPIRFTDGTFMVLSDDLPGTRIGFTLYSRTGAMLRQSFVVAAASNPVRWGRLSNGNIAVFAISSSTARAMVVAQDTSTVIPWVTLENAVGLYAMPDLLCLSGGGFAATWSVGLPAAIRFAIYSNTLTTVLAPTTLSTAPTGGGANEAILRQFANGNIALFTRQWAPGRPAMLGIYTPAGVAVRALASWAPMAGDEQIPSRVVVLGDSMCAAWVVPASNTLKAAVINSAGVSQGTTYSLGSSQMWIGAGHDGTDFHLLGMTVTGNFAQHIRVPVTGGANATLRMNYSAIASGAFGNFAASWIDSEWLVVTHVIGTGYSFVRVDQDARVSPGGSIPVNSSQSLIADPLQVHAGAAIFVHSNPSNFMAFTAKRYRSAAIQGVATAAAARLATVPVLAPVGTFQCNSIALTTPLNFNHNATTVLGQRGTLYSRSVSLRGVA
jgi:hypothetical protein